MTGFFLLLGGICVGGVMGYMTCLSGTWVRMHQNESRIRNLIVSIRVLQDMKDEIPPQWVLMELESMVAKDYQ